jgi:hypothetical protein
MVRASFVNPPGASPRQGRRQTRQLATLVCAVIGAVSLVAQAPSQDPSSKVAGATAGPEAEARAVTRVVGALLERAGDIEPGTYVTSGSAFEPAAEPEPMVIQADALRGSDQSIRAAISLGAVVPRPVVTRARVVDASTPNRTVVSDVAGSSPAGLVRAVSQLALKPGNYELLAAVAHTRPEGGVVASLAKSRLVVPDLWRSAPAVSPIVLGDAVAAAPRGSAGQPFAFGPTALRPAASNRFARSGELHVAFRVFNWAAKPEEEPDLLVEYVFYERTPRRAHFFNKVKPQRLNADTLGDRFDPASGVVNGGMSIPLESFPFSEFQLTVRVTDNRTKQTVAQEARFTVVP